MATGVQITEQAASRIKELLDGDERDLTGLRLKVVGGGCSGLQYKMDLDNPKPTDRVFEQAGAKVIVDLKSLLYLGGHRARLQGVPHGGGLRVPEPPTSSAVAAAAPRSWSEATRCPTSSISTTTQPRAWRRRSTRPWRPTSPSFTATRPASTASGAASAGPSTAPGLRWRGFWAPATRSR